MKKRILIFGGGENQYTLIKAAKTLGVETIVIDPNANAPGEEIADHFEVVGGADYERTKEIALKYKVDGIVTSQMENPLMIMAQLANELGYIFPSPDVILQCRNKYLMKQVFIKNDIPCAKGLLIEPDEVINSDKLKDFSFPLIIKPIDAHSSRGVYKVNNYSELVEFEKETRFFSSDKSLLVEEFIGGKEYSVESLTFQGKTTVIQVTEKIITSYPYTVEIGHIQPAEITSSEKQAIENTVRQAIHALDIENSASHTELKLTSQGPVIIEVGARLGGDYISSYLTQASTGINMDKAAIQIALGNTPEISNFNKAYSYIKYLELPVGKKVQSVGNWKEILNEEHVIHANVLLKKGDIVSPISDSAKRPGFVLVRGSSRNEIQTEATRMIEKISTYITLN